MNNFSSMAAVMAAIDSPQITRLKRTRGGLSKQMKADQKTLSDLIDPGRGHRAYRELLSDVKTAACLPWLGEHSSTTNPFDVLFMPPFKLYI